MSKLETTARIVANATAEMKTAKTFHQRPSPCGTPARWRATERLQRFCAYSPPAWA